MKGKCQIELILYKVGDCRSVGDKQLQFILDPKKGKCSFTTMLFMFDERKRASEVSVSPLRGRKKEEFGDTWHTTELCLSYF